MIGPQLPDESPRVVDDRTLRQFAGLCVVIFGTLFALSWYRNQGSPTVAARVGLLFALFVGLPGLIRVGWIRPVFLTATAATRPIGHIVGLCVLALIYFGFITPLGWSFRSIGRNLMKRLPPETPTYWVPASEPVDIRRYVHQYQNERSFAHAHSSGVIHGFAQSSD